MKGKVFLPDTIVPQAQGKVQKRWDLCYTQEEKEPRLWTPSSNVQRWVGLRGILKVQHNGFGVQLITIEGLRERKLSVWLPGHQCGELGTLCLLTQGIVFKERAWREDDVFSLGCIWAGNYAEHNVVASFLYCRHLSCCLVVGGYLRSPPWDPSTNTYQFLPPKPCPLPEIALAKALSNTSTTELSIFKWMCLTQQVLLSVTSCSVLLPASVWTFALFFLYFLALTLSSFPVKTLLQPPSNTFPLLPAP